ncbi:MAG TPA: sterol desaturase family protein [Candidatus Limnocylindrales bacterium]|nr:sterol desaturase family protein [Candidatus Limnocylindrales bacterium]
MTVLVMFGAIAGFFFVVERLFPRVPAQRIMRRGFFADMLYLPVQYVLRVLISFLGASLLTEIGSRSLPGSVSILSGRPIWLQAIVVVIVLDFFFYVMHRLKHRWHWWWRLHETHHSSEEMDFLSSVRFHPLEKLLDRVIFLLPLTVLGADEPALLVWSGIDVFFGMLNHSNTRIRLGPLHAIFVGPEMHLWHHVQDPVRGDCNFGNNLSIFDWMFGTARLHDEEPVHFGIETPDFPHESFVRQFFFAFRTRDQFDIARTMASVEQQAARLKLGKDGAALGRAATE